MRNRQGTTQLPAPEKGYQPTQKQTPQKGQDMHTHQNPQTDTPQKETNMDTHQNPQTDTPLKGQDMHTHQNPQTDTPQKETNMDTPPKASIRLIRDSYHDAIERRPSRYANEGKDYRGWAERADKWWQAEGYQAYQNRWIKALIKNCELALNNLPTVTPQQQKTKQELEKRLAKLRTYTN